MTPKIKTFLAIEGLSFAAAAAIHAGILIHGYEHAKAATAESVIALVLFAGLAVCLFLPGVASQAAMSAQGFALLGTFVGLFTIAIGVGPRTVPDLTYHFLIILVLLAGFSIAFKDARGRHRAQRN